MKKSVLTICFMALAVIPVAAHASLILSPLNISGTADVSNGSLVFGTGTFDISTGAWGASGAIMSLTGVSDPVNTALDVPDFMTFDSNPNISITLTGLAGGTDGEAGCTASPAAAGQVCTPAPPISTDLSPYNLQNIPLGNTLGSSASFSITGVEVDSSTGQTANVSGIFTTQFDVPYQTLLTDIITNGGTVPTTFSASLFVTPVPEPASLAGLMLAMGAGLGVIYRRKLKKG